MRLRRYDTETGLMDGSIAPKGFERSGFDVKGKKTLIMLGAAVLVLAIIVALAVSFNTLLLIYTVFMIFILLIYLCIWMDGASDTTEPHMPMKKWPDVTLVIPSYNAGHTILECIEACKNMHYAGKKEIIVVDDGSTDGSINEIRKIDGITLMHKEKNAGKGAALNMAIRKAKGELVACVDSDTYPEIHALERAVPFFNDDEKLGGLVFFICAAKPKNLIQRLQELEYWVSFGFYFKTISFIKGLHITPGPMAMYRKSIFIELGGFDEKNIAEDMEIALRLRRHGWNLTTCHTAKVYTEVPVSIGSLYKQRLRWFRGGILNLFKYTDMFLNPRFGSLGLFTLPMMLSTGLFAALFTFWMLSDWARSFLSAIMPTFSNWQAVLPGIFMVPALDPLMLSSTILVGLVPAFIWGFFLWSGFHIAGEKPKAAHILPCICLMSVYPLFLGVTFLSAYAHELSGRGYKW